MEPVPISEVKLTIPMDSLRNLPPRAGYTAKSGRANVGVHTRGDTLIVYATCDSLRRMCEYYESISGIYKKGYEELQSSIRTEKEQRSNPVKIAITAFIAGLATGIVPIFLKRRRI